MHSAKQKAKDKALKGKEKEVPKEDKTPKKPPIEPKENDVCKMHKTPAMNNNNCFKTQEFIPPRTPIIVHDENIKSGNKTPEEDLSSNVYEKIKFMQTLKKLKVLPWKSGRMKLIALSYSPSMLY